MKTSPTQRSLKLLRAAGYQAAIVEHWNPFARIRQDLYGFIDIIAVGEGETVGVQTTTSSNMAARATKIRLSTSLPALLRSGWRIVVHGWVKRKNGRWEVREEEISL